MAERQRSTPDDPSRPVVLRPLVDFLHTEAAGGVVLLAATLVALAWANSPFKDSYTELWHTEFAVTLGHHTLELDLQEWVNDGLMAIFFFVVGLEIKRELVEGELREPRRAAMPAIAAVGGMMLPALIYTAINRGGDGAAGWGIPMATDIAMAVGVLSLLGRRVAPSLKLFLLALAIVDDIGAIIVIALFYSGDIQLDALALAAGIVVVVGLVRRAGVRPFAVYVLLGIGLWLAIHESGLHATLTGVILGLMAPTRPIRQRRLIDEEALTDLSTPGAAHETMVLAKESVSVVEYLEHLLHPWTSFVILPIFALANAGIPLSSEALSDAASSPITYGVVAGLVVGKLVGVTLFTWLAARLRIGVLPVGARWRDVVGVGMLAGIGFTVSIFVAGLAFDDAGLQNEAKVGILAASAIAAAAGSFLLFRAGDAPSAPGALGAADEPVRPAAEEGARPAHATMERVSESTGDRTTRGFVRPLLARSTDEEHRVSTPLELFFDLCFVVAVAQASNSLHHALAEDDLHQAIVGYPIAFFAIWWAWMNFTWFSSAYDNDDVLYRVGVFVQIIGVLILAAGVPRAFSGTSFAIVTLGYAVMRVGLVFLWLRAARDDPPRRQTDTRYAVGISVCMVGWGLLLLVPDGLHVPGIIVMVAAELLVPVWAEQSTPTSWHPHHIAERFGLFTLIVLGESVAAATIAIQGAADTGGSVGDLLDVAAGGVLVVFAMWWMYFAQPVGRIVERARASLDQSSWRQAFLWGYGHYVVFASAAAVGAGLAVAADQAIGHADLSTRAATTCVAVPAALYVLSVWAVHVTAKPVGPVRAAPPCAAVLVVLVALAGLPVVAVGLVLVALVIFSELVTRAA